MGRNAPKTAKRNRLRLLTTRIESNVKFSARPPHGSEVGLTRFLAGFALTARRDSLGSLIRAGSAAMDDLIFKLADEEIPRDRLALLLEHFSKLSDERESWRVMYPLAEVLLLLTCATICSCDDFDEIATWGESHLAFLRRFSEFHFGIPGERWLRDLVNRIDPIMFGRCFESWIAALWPGRHDLIAIDGSVLQTHTEGEFPMND